MGLLTIGTPFNIELEFTTAPLIKRAAAVFLDMLLLLLYMSVVYRFVFIEFDMGKIMSDLVMMSGISIFPFLYFPVTETLMNGQTPGKKICGIKVLDKQGNEPSMSQYLLRWLLGPGNYAVFLLPYILVSSAGLSIIFFCLLTIILFYLPDFLCAAISVKNQRIADIAAGTVVIDLKKKTNFSETIYLDIQDENAPVLYPQVLQLSDRDINGIRNLLSKNPKTRTDLKYRNTIVNRIKEVIHIYEEHDDDTAFLEQLLRDYNYLTQKR